MKLLWKGVWAHAVIGFTSSLIHWQVFFVLASTTSLDQAASNFAAFCVAASYSFYMNALYTFESSTSVGAYLAFIGGMAGMSYGIGYFADSQNLPGLMTLGVFTFFNLVFGFCLYRFVLFGVAEE
ncbi:GtrA family protein [Pseudomonas sp. NPDC089534]|uniref:GtrA family protein n=1 Tax=Pseudomonas sp. NPDC089534 TaxID=3364468 RepID=UPI003814ABE3